jgi:tripartite-type tricarboxylate transporter receptor subunit TctC
MEVNRRKALKQLAAGSLVAASVLGMAPAIAQETAYPTRAVRLVVPYPAGGATDVMARAISEQLARRWGKPVVVENRPGAAGLIGADNVAKAAPDGYSLLLALASVVQTPYMVAKPPFDPLRDLAPITQLCTTNMVLAASTSTPKPLTELVRQAKAHPDKFTYGTYGTGTGSHLYMEVFTANSGARLTHVPYKGEAPIVNDMLGGQISLGTISPMSVRQHLKSGRITPLAVTGDTRSPLLPDVPTFQELGYKGLSGPAWFGLFATAGTPGAIVDKISADVAAVANTPEMRTRMLELGLVIKTSQPAEFRALTRTDQAYWADVIRQHNIRLE